MTSGLENEDPITEAGDTGRTLEVFGDPPHEA
jgi:hypothetical protein